MQAEYSAAIKVTKGAGSVDVTFSQPLSPETIAKFKHLSERYVDVQVYDIPQALGRSGFWIMYSPDLRSGESIAQECLKILKAESFVESRIRLVNFTADE
jgi:hypothetical protein